MKIYVWLGLGPGKWIKKVKEFVLDKQLENPMLTKEEAWKMLLLYVEEKLEQIGDKVVE